MGKDVCFSIKMMAAGQDKICVLIYPDPAYRKIALIITKNSHNLFISQLIDFCRHVHIPFSSVAKYISHMNLKISGGRRRN